MKIGELKECSESFYKAVISDMDSVYKAIEHTYNVLGTGFDKVDTDTMISLYEQMNVAMIDMNIIKNVLVQSDKVIEDD